MTETEGKEGHSKNQDIVTKDDDIPAPVHRIRRRSSFFAEARRRSLGNTILDESCSPQSSKVSEMDAYIVQLQKEEMRWKDMMNRRRSEYQEAHRMLNEFCKERQVMTEEEGWSNLEENQKSYFSKLPNFNFTESRYNYNSNLILMYKDQELTNRITLMKVLERAGDNIEACKAKIQQYTTRI